jgi:putative ABC transport system permease protein
MFENYIKTAFKVLLRRKFFTFISLFAICFTLVVLIVASTMLDHIFGPHAPEKFSDRTIGVYGLTLAGKDMRRTGRAGYKFLTQYVTTLPHTEMVSLIESQHEVASYKDGRKLTSYIKHTDGQFWRVYDFKFVEGRPYTAEDDVKANPVAVINVATREKFFGGENALGKKIELDGQNLTVIGVVENVPITRFAPFSDVWAPIGTMRSKAFRDEYMGNFMAVVIAKNKSDIPAIQREYQQRVRTAPTPDPKMYDSFSGGIDTPFEFLAREMTIDHSRPVSENKRSGVLFGILAGLSLLFMALPAVNLVNINASRILERSSEIGVRKAFGASSLTLVGQFLVENLFVTLAGGLLALVFAPVLLSVLNSTGLILYSQFSLNWRVFGYGLAFALAFGLVSGVYPAWRMSRLDPVAALRGRNR